MLYVNRDSQRRVWPALQGADGRTLELGPGETVELDQEVVDPHLVPADGASFASTAPEDQPPAEEQAETVEEPAAQFDPLEVESHEPVATASNLEEDDNEEPQL